MDQFSYVVVDRPMQVTKSAFLGPFWIYLGGSNPPGEIQKKKLPNISLQKEPLDNGFDLL